MAGALPAATTTSVRVVAIRQQIGQPVVGQFARKGMGRGKGILFCLRDIQVTNFLFVKCVPFDLLSKFSSRGGSNILVDNWVSSPEKDWIILRSRNALLIPRRKGKFEYPGRYLRKSIRKRLNNPSVQEWVVNSSEKGILKKKTIDIPRGITDVKSVNKAFECHNGQKIRYPDGYEKKSLRRKAEKGMGNPIDPG